MDRGWNTFINVGNWGKMKYLFAAAMLLQGIYLQASQLRGAVRDAETKEELIGALIYLEGLNVSTTTGLDGTYSLKGLDEGSYTVNVKYIGYADQQAVIAVSGSGESRMDFALKNATTELGQITISARADRSSDMSARTSEKQAMQVLNVVSASTIELSPDLNVAGVVQRISGVTLERNSSGEAQYAVMRGMDKRYNYTLINGMKIPSPHNKHRFVPLNIFPSELADRVEVYKTLTPDMEADGTGGVINMVMKDSPPGAFVAVNFATGYNSFFLSNDMLMFPVSGVTEQSPRAEHGKNYEASLPELSSQLGVLENSRAAPDYSAGLSAGSRFFNNKLGLIVAGNYSSASRGSNSAIFSESFSQQHNSAVITSMTERTYTEKNIQKGLHIKTDYMLGAKHSFDWYNAYIGAEKYQVRQSTKTNFSFNYNPEAGDLDLSYQTRLSSNMQDLLVSSLHGKHALGRQLTFTWAGMYSIAKNQDPERSYLNLDRIQLGDIVNVYPDADGSTIEWANNSDRDITGFGNLIYWFEMGQNKMELKTGGMARAKKRKNSLVEYRIRPEGQQSQGADFNTIDEIEWRLDNPLAGSVGPLEYDAHENISAAYAMATFSGKLGSLQGGARIEFTDQGYFQYYPAMGEDSSGAQKYSDLLPSVQAKITPADNINIRLSYFKSINRPGFFEIVPYLHMDEDYREFGNKDLKRAKIDNIDLRFEFFPKSTEQILAGVFYKKIKDPIELLYTTVNRRQYGFGPGNVGNAANLGFELDLIKYFRWIGFKANYTYTFSQITTDKTIYVQNASGQTTRSFVKQKRPLVGQSPHTANLAVMLKSTKGYDAQLAASYNHDKLIIVSDFKDSDYWMSKSIQLDASFEKRWNNGLSVFGKINNLLNTPMFYYIKYSVDQNTKLPLQDLMSGNTVVRRDEYSRSFTIGLRKKFTNKNS
jgi:outer membrane receptor protein involved in Fe transport